MESLKNKFLDIFKRAIGHTRIAISGSYPLYRLMCLGGIFSSVLSMIYGKYPGSLSATTDHNSAVMNAFNIMQLVGCLCIAAAFYMHKNRDPRPTRVQLSLALERLGIVLLIPVVGAYTYGVIQNNGGPPTTWATWGLAMFCLYLIYRFFEIGAALKEVQRPLEECTEGECNTEGMSSE